MKLRAAAWREGGEGVYPHEDRFSDRRTFGKLVPRFS